MKRRIGKIHIGTSGWHYKHWMERFYPKGMKSTEFLDYYLKFFQTVEINNSFYRLPEPNTFKNWRNSVPPDFQFAVKASRFITHMKKLKDVQDSFQNFLDNAKELKEKLGVILFQFPPGWKYNEERFLDFVKTLPPEHRYTFEFRNPTWYNDRLYSILREYNLAFCIYEIEYHQSPIVVTADFVYVRLHGPETKYAGSYSEAALRKWGDQCLQWKKQLKDVYFFFDNDQDAFAAYNAIRLQEIVSEKKHQS